MHSFFARAFSMNLIALGLFLISATALLGSPGPGIAALLAVGRSRGFPKGLNYFLGLQLGLAVIASLCAAGLLSLLDLVPGALRLIALIAGAYLLYIAWQIARAPVGATEAGKAAGTSDRLFSSFGAGLLLGLSNPKAFIVFISLFASQTIIAGNQRADSVLKWQLVVTIMIAVDLAWLAIGARLRRARLRPATEQALNVTLGLLIVAATVLAFL
jgi:threonine/homoserine/homoserine lactone efflux protein